MNFSDLLKQIPGIIKSPENWPIAGKQWIVDFVAWLGTACGITLPPWVLELVDILIVIVAIIAVYLVMFALMSVWERKILALAQNRYGPNRVGPWGLFQPVADGIKMFTKEDIVPRNADQIVHFLATIVMLVPALILPVILPYGRGMVAVELSVDILFFFAVGAGTELAVFLAGWSSRNKYSILGAMRAIAQMISYELPLVMSAVVVALVAPPGSSRRRAVSNSASSPTSSCSLHGASSLASSSTWARWPSPTAARSTSRKANPNSSRAILPNTPGSNTPSSSWRNTSACSPSTACW